jgi:hypothetical protein
MWGFSISFLQTVVSIANVLALVGGILAGAGLFVSAVVSSRIADTVQADADRRIEDARTKGDEARATASQANEKIAELNVTAAQLKSKNLELEADIAPRRIAQLNPALQSALGRMAPKVIKLTSYALDPDGAVLATQMFDLLQAQNFTIQDHRMTQGPSTSLNFGVWVFGSDKALVGILVALLNSAGIFAIAQEPRISASVSFSFTDPAVAVPAPDASIFVGVKPLRGMLTPR